MKPVSPLPLPHPLPLDLPPQPQPQPKHHRGAPESQQRRDPPPPQHPLHAPATLVSPHSHSNFHSHFNFHSPSNLHSHSPPVAPAVAGARVPTRVWAAPPQPLLLVSFFPLVPDGHDRRAVKPSHPLTLARRQAEAQAQESRTKITLHSPAQQRMALRDFRLGLGEFPSACAEARDGLGDVPV
ncbi:hypothetical protein B2J93_514 [Marssonina coronariae]|uniref:Uncharacterized protein n=1 Tax=Diplocarpon coronariae TaxID=2795749 RepID=A0A218Z2E8_9HELO|nr:hypothetical protein B2J93_514 [Marssonina coronariae]